MNIKRLKDDIQLEGKKVLLRSELNVPVQDGKVTDNIRIRAAVPTIQHIIKGKPRILVIVAHLGRPEGVRDEKFSNKSIAVELERLLNKQIKLLESLEDLEKIVIDSGREEKLVYLLENIRFWKEEEQGDADFGKKIGKMFDVYVNDCFSASHRAHASIVEIPKHTDEKCMGLLFEEELGNLEKVMKNPKHPAVAVIGGAKIETKLPVIENLRNKYDSILVGGMVANEALDENVKLEKVILPMDFSPAGKEDQRLDIGSLTVKKYSKILESAKTIVWNGPMGKFENEDAAEGTKKIMQAIADNHEALQVVGGGETLDAIRKWGNFSDFDYVSMSGGAMLEFLSGKKLPGIEALEI